MSLTSSQSSSKVLAASTLVISMSLEERAGAVTREHREPAMHGRSTNQVID